MCLYKKQRSIISSIMYQEKLLFKNLEMIILLRLSCNHVVYDSVKVFSYFVFESANDRKSIFMLLRFQLYTFTRQFLYFELLICLKTNIIKYCSTEHILDNITKNDKFFDKTLMKFTSFYVGRKNLHKYVLTVRFRCTAIIV